MSHSYPSDISREQFARILPTLGGPDAGPSPASPWVWCFLVAVRFVTELVTFIE